MNTKPDNKPQSPPLPPFTLPPPEPLTLRLWVAEGDTGDESLKASYGYQVGAVRPATVDDLRAVVRMLPPDGHGLGPGGSLVRATLVRDIENAVEVEKQAQSFALSHAGAKYSANAIRQELRYAKTFSDIAE